MVDIYNGPGSIINADCINYKFAEYDFAVAFLVVMFIPVAERFKWIAQMRKLIKPGGALIIFDKCEPVKGYASVVLSRLALNMKLENGVDPREIIDKELSLSGIQRPISLSIIPEDAVELFRFGDFAGWLIESENI